MSLYKELSCEAGSFSLSHIPHRFLQPEVVRIYFPALEPWVVYSVSLPSCSSRFIRPGPPATALPRVLPSDCRLHPSCQSQCFFFNSFVVRPYTVRFSGSFGCFFVFKFVVVLLLVVQGSKALCTYTSIFVVIIFNVFTQGPEK